MDSSWTMFSLTALIFLSAVNLTSGSRALENELTAYQLLTELFPDRYNCPRPCFTGVEKKFGEVRYPQDLFKPGLGTDDYEKNFGDVLTSDPTQWTFSPGPFITQFPVKGDSYPQKAEITLLNAIDNIGKAVCIRADTLHHFHSQKNKQRHQNNRQKYHTLAFYRRLFARDAMLSRVDQIMGKTAFYIPRTKRKQWGRTIEPMESYINDVKRVLFCYCHSLHILHKGSFLKKPRYCDERESHRTIKVYHEGEPNPIYQPLQDNNQVANIGPQASQGILPAVSTSASAGASSAAAQGMPPVLPNSPYPQSHFEPSAFQPRANPSSFAAPAGLPVFEQAYPYQQFPATNWQPPVPLGQLYAPQFAAQFQRQEIHPWSLVPPPPLYQQQGFSHLANHATMGSWASQHSTHGSQAYPWVQNFAQYYQPPPQPMHQTPTTHQYAAAPLPPGGGNAGPQAAAQSLGYGHATSAAYRARWHR